MSYFIKDTLMYYTKHLKWDRDKRKRNIDIICDLMWQKNIKNKIKSFN